MAAFPIATTAGGICFAFPDVCNTPSPGGTVPIPYPNIGQLSDATSTSDGPGGKGRVEVGGELVLIAGSTILSTTGDEAGSAGGVNSVVTRGAVTFEQGSQIVKIHGKSVVRMFDPTKQNEGNANGFVLGGVPNVLVGG